MQTIEFNYIQFTSEEQLHEFLKGITYTLSKEVDWLYYALEVDWHCYADLTIGDYVLRKGNCVTILTKEEFDASKIA